MKKQLLQLSVTAIMMAMPQQMKAGVSINSSNFPDAAFRQYVKENFDKNSDNYISDNEISTAFSIVVNEMGISNLAGIQYFTSLTYLSCYKNQLSSIDISKNTKLRILQCFDNQLTSLDVSKNTALDFLSCFENQLTSLDVSKNTALTSLQCSDNQLTSLDVSKNTALDYLSCGYNQLTSLDVSKNTALTRLYCSDNQLISLDVSKNTALTELLCYGNQLTSLDVSKNTALTVLYCWDNQLTSLDVSKNTALTVLYCDNNQLTSLDASKNTALTRLYCYGNQLTSLDVPKNLALEKLWCWNNPLKEIDLSKNTHLKELACYQTQIDELDVSKNTELEILYCHTNNLKKLDVSKNIKLTQLYCGYCQLTNLDVSKNTALEILSCPDNKLSILDVSKNTALKAIACGKNQLKALDVSHNPQIIEINMRYNQIKGAAMYSLIDGLPAVEEGYIKALASTLGDEKNEITNAQVAMARRKGWITYRWIAADDNNGLWAEYEGGDNQNDEICALTDGEKVDFYTMLDENSNLDGYVVGNIYYNIYSQCGNYDPLEGCIVVTKPTDNSVVEGKDISDADFKAGFTGLVFKVAAGRGTIKIETETLGSMTLRVKVGNNEPLEHSVTGRKSVHCPYNVSEDSYIYIYGGTNANNAKGMRKANGTDALKIYGIEVTGRQDGIEQIKDERLKKKDSFYDLQGRKIGNLPTQKGIYIKDGRKVLVK